MAVSEVAAIFAPIIGGMLNDAYGITASLWLAFGASIVCIGLTLAMGETRASVLASAAAK
jgi:hypothetical protein